MRESTHNSVDATVQRLNQRLGLDDSGQWDSTGITAHHAACYGGYRLETKKGSTGFARNNGTENRLSRKEFLIYLKGLHDMLDYIDMAGGAA
jgi:hypothetical protein